LVLLLFVLGVAAAIAQAQAVRVDQVVLVVVDEGLVVELPLAVLAHPGKVVREARVLADQRHITVLAAAVALVQ
jgi:hypothetical protein